MSQAQAQTSRATVSATAELCAYIIDFLHGSAVDLKSCALVSHAFTFPAQGHLFNEIHILSSSTATALVRLLQATPHLLPLVQRVKALVNSDILAHITKICLPRLNYLLLSQVGYNAVSTSRVYALQDLISLPSLRTLIIGGVKFRDSAALDLLFERCTPSLQRIDLRNVTLKDPHVSIPSSPPAAQSRPRVLLKALHLMQSINVGRWLLDSQCRLDVSQLSYIDLYSSSSPELAQALGAASTTIEELHLHTADLMTGLSLAPFTIIKKLQIMGGPSDLATAISSFPSRLDRLQVLRIASRAFMPYAEMRHGPTRDSTQTHLTHIDAAVATTHLPALTRVELFMWQPVGEDALTSTADLQPTEAAVHPVERTRTALVRAFPQLHARSVLVVRDYRGT
ncbi:hypothetical protein B0H19DRAFT_1379028 [Mycena capillaripes]|nr:hypothetical protein B0H19DRAFT_1379028 [Mycena capillaripes]